MAKLKPRLAACVVAALGLVAACGRVHVADESAPALEAGDDPTRGVGGSRDAALEESGSDAAKSRFCDLAKHALCEDFDENSYGDSWTNIVTKGDALALDFGSSVSPPVSLVAQRSAAAPDDAFLQRTFTGQFARALLQADVMVVSAPEGAARLTLLDLAFVAESGSPSRHLRFAHRATKLEIAEAHFGDDAGDDVRFSEEEATTFPVGEWVHVAIAVDAAARRTKVTVDGAAVFDEALAQGWAPAGVEVTVGAFATYGEPGEWMVRFDNVALDLQ